MPKGKKKKNKLCLPPIPADHPNSNAKKSDGKANPKKSTEVPKTITEEPKEKTTEGSESETPNEATTVSNEVQNTAEKPTPSVEEPKEKTPRKDEISVKSKKNKVDAYDIRALMKSSNDRELYGKRKRKRLTMEVEDRVTR